MRKLFIIACLGAPFVGLLAADTDVESAAEAPRVQPDPTVLMTVEEAEAAYYTPIDLEDAVLPEDIFSELKDIIYQMADRAPAAQMARERIVEAQGLGLVDESARLPKLGGFVQYNYQTEQRQNSGSKDGPEFFWSINAEQPVYQWGALEARGEIGALREKSVRTRNVGDYIGLLKEVRNLYLRIFQRNVSIQLANEWLKVAQEDLAKARRQEKAGELTEISLLEAEVRVQQNEADILQQEQDLAFLKHRLRAISGWTGPILSNYNHELRSFLGTPVVEEETPASGNPTQSWVYRDLQTQIDIEDRNYTIARAENLPRFSVVGGIFQDRIDSAFLATSEERINFFVGGLVSWSLFDGYATTGKKMAALARKRRLERQAGLQVNIYRAEYTRISAALDTARRGIVINARLYGLSEAKLAAAERRYANGAISSAELLYAKSGRNQSQLSLIDAKINYLDALGDYLSLTGEDPSLQRMEDRVRPVDLPEVLNPWGIYQ